MRDKTVSEGNCSSVFIIVNYIYALRLGYKCHMYTVKCQFELQSQFMKLPINHNMRQKRKPF